MKFLLIMIMISSSSCALWPTAENKARWEKEMAESKKKEELRRNGLQLGMSKSEVLILKGEPKRRGAQKSSEYFIYDEQVHRPWHSIYYEEHFVRFVDGKVESFGRVGDFDSTKDPSSTMNVNIKNN